MNVDVTETPADIVQDVDPYDPARPINVQVCGPIQTRELPAQQTGYKTDQGVGTAVAVKLLPFEPRRKSALIMAVGQDMWVSGSQAGAQVGAAGSIRVPASVPWPVDHLDEVWACAVTGSTDISVQSSYWTA